MIRQLTVNDAEQITDLVGEFFTEELGCRGYNFSRGECLNDIVTLSKMPQVIALGIDNNGVLDGILVAFVMRRFFLGTTTAQELVWYVRKTVRKEGVLLLKVFERIAKERGVDDVTMIALKNTKAEEFYPRFDYTISETMYVKKINGG